MNCVALGNVSVQPPVFKIFVPSGAVALATELNPPPTVFITNLYTCIVPLGKLDPDVPAAPV